MTHPPGAASVLGFLSAPFVPPAAVGAADVAVVALYLLVTVAIGLWVGRGQKDLADYLLGDRNLPWWAVLGSIVATETSTATVLSIPGWAYAKEGDFRGLQLAMGYVLGRIVVTAVLLPQYFLEEKTGRDFPPAITHPEYFYGFIGVTIAWQLAFLVISRDPIRYRPLMPVAVVEKAAFGPAMIVLYLLERVNLEMLGAGILDMLIGAFFIAAFLRTPTSAAPDGR